MGIVGALVLCLSTAVCYAEMAKLYPGTGSSYYFAEQAFLNRDKAWKYARISKFVVGWASHLYYWIYPGVMVGTMGILCGYLVGTLWPNFMSASNPGMLFMMAVAVVFAFCIAYIAHRGVSSSTAINMGINVIQITALLIFSVMALKYRADHPAGSVAYQFDSTSGRLIRTSSRRLRRWLPVFRRIRFCAIPAGVPLPKLDAAGKPVPFKIAYDEKDTRDRAFLAHPTALSVDQAA